MPGTTSKLSATSCAMAPTPGYENIQLVQLGAEGTTGRQGVFLLMAKGNDLEREGISKVKLVEKGETCFHLLSLLYQELHWILGSHHGYKRIPLAGSNSILGFLARKLVHPIFPPAV